MSSNFTLKACAALFASMLTVASYGQTTPVKKFGKPSAFTKCASTEYEKYLEKKFPNRKSTAEFEQWLSPKVAAVKNQNFAKSTNSTNTIVTIPVVVHIIHSGDPVGTNENITNEQVLSQITVLNEDFRRMLGTNGYNEHPDGADIEVNFCLAQRDPNGLLSTGITRHVMTSQTQEGWDMTELEEIVKPQTQWDPEQYLNIWVVDYIFVNGLFELAGYAQFPTDSGLDGLEDPSMPTTAETDGVVIEYNYFGSVETYPDGDYAPNGDLGRTATHEVGHYLGLRHIWGDGTPGECDGTDYCEDTPQADQANQGCPNGQDSCTTASGNDMIENYMDYTFDACKNVFTQDQKDRITAVLANSPRRVSLATSLGCTPGMVYDNDGSLEIQIETGCSKTATPALVLTNTGNNILTSAVISYRFDENTPETYEWEGSLENGASATIELAGQELTSGEHTFSVSITSVNEGEDEAPSNDTKSVDFDIVRDYMTNGVVVTVTTDAFGEETYWAIVDSEENFITLQGPLESNETYSMEVELEPGQCYTFGIIDFAGDGICCEYGNGSYQVKTMNNEIIAEGGEFASTEYATFGINITMDNKDFTLLGRTTLYPNPANNVLNIVMPNNELPEGYTIYNSLGQVMATAKVTTAANLIINTSAYSNGIYFIKIEKGGQAQTLKFVKN